MNKFFTLCIGLFAFVFLTNFVKEKGVIKERLEICFDKHTSFAELVSIKEQCEKLGIILSFKNIEYKNYGELSALSFTPDCQDGFSGSATSDDIIHINQKFGFFRDYRKDAIIPFATGQFQ
jgi:hypothetical protein